MPASKILIQAGTTPSRSAVRPESVREAVVFRINQGVSKPTLPSSRLDRAIVFDCTRTASNKLWRERHYQLLFRQNAQHLGRVAGCPDRVRIQGLLLSSGEMLARVDHPRFPNARGAVSDTPVQQCPEISLRLLRRQLYDLLEQSFARSTSPGISE